MNTATDEIGKIKEICDKLLGKLCDCSGNVLDWYKEIACMEQHIDDMTKEYRDNMFERIQNGTCSDEGSILFSEMLTDFERIGDHGLNIADEIVKERKDSGLCIKTGLKTRYSMLQYL